MDYHGFAGVNEIHLHSVKVHSRVDFIEMSLRQRMTFHILTDVNITYIDPLITNHDCDRFNN